jgi:type II secretion system protein I
MSRRPLPRHSGRGFTLLEVLIALAIVAMSAGALLGTITSSASNVSYLHDKTLAEWVALNRLTEIRIAQQMAPKGKRTGNAEMGGMRWQWEEEITEMELVKGLFRVDVRARPTGETVDESRAVEQQTSQTETKSESSGSETAKLAWTTTVTGFIGSAQSDRRDAIATPMRGAAGSRTSNKPGDGNPTGSPGTPGTPVMPPGGGEPKHSDR